MRLTVGILVASVVLRASSVASAQYHGDSSDDPISGETQSALRFHVDTMLFRYAAETSTQDVGGMSESQTRNTIAVGNSHGFAGIFGTLSMGLGYAFSDSILVGSSLQLGYESLGDSESDASQGYLLFGLAPYFEYMGGDSGTKPFIGATLQLRHLSGSLVVDGDAEETLSFTYVGAGITGGAHFFVADACSIDLGAKLTYNVLASSDPELPEGSSLTVLDFLVTLGVSAWIL